MVVSCQRVPRQVLCAYRVRSRSTRRSTTRAYRKVQKNPRRCEAGRVQLLVSYLWDIAAKFICFCPTMCAAADSSFSDIEVGIKHDHEGQRKAARTAKASAPIVKIEQDAPKVESIDTSSDDDNTRLTREVDSLKHSIQVLERDLEEHISIMRHLVYDMLQNHVELTDVVRERSHRHAPSVLPKHSWETSQDKPITHHVHNYPYTPSPSSATPTVVKRKRDGSLDVSRTRSPPNALAQDLPRSDHDFLLSPEKRQKTGLAAQNEKLPSTAADSQFTSPEIYTDE